VSSRGSVILSVKYALLRASGLRGMQLNRFRQSDWSTTRVASAQLVYVNDTRPFPSFPHKTLSFLLPPLLFRGRKRVDYARLGAAGEANHQSRHLLM